ncbi:MAG: acyl-CoA/acyl-ACP dehydrogenase [Desulfobacterota bacterium]|nr:acyl-CoA/acyl-ACP dehydrogenase [Thermodesulfobacteriota bacterium]MDW8002342.1 acyl-CoA dehydrogenase family protein [Deltaproteobacteria bacterium]
MFPYPWWTDEQKRFAEEVQTFVRELIPIDVKSRWKRQFPWEIFEKISERGYTGAGIPKEYGGMGLGATGACIAAEALNIMPGPGRVFVGNMLGGLRQIIEFGTEEQKKRFLPRIAKGEIGAIVITEPFAGTDAAAQHVRAKKVGDVYILNGKKRFIVSAGVATRYMVYARTSDDPQDIANYRHLTGFIVEKGMAGFNVEKINEIAGFENIQNGVLNFNNTPCPVENRIGEEGEGWKVMTNGLNFERTLISAQVLGWMWEIIRYVIPYAERRVQFGRPTIDFTNNQLKLADLFIRYYTARLLTYYTAYLWDIGWDITIESNVAKVYNCESVLSSALDGIQVMGGDGLTPFYPLLSIMNVSKVENIAGGTMEACRLVILRSAMRKLKEHIKPQKRAIDKDLGVPVPVVGFTSTDEEPDESNVLRVLAEDYRVNPGLYMKVEDICEYFGCEKEKIVPVLESLERKGLVSLFRQKNQIMMAKATYEGLNEAFDFEYYRWFPFWVEKKNIF